MQVRVAELLRVRHAKARGPARERSDVADLAAGLGVERRAVERDLHLFAGRGRVDFRATLQDRLDAALVHEPLVATECARGIERFGPAQVHAELARRARALAL